jgi:uncharacterized protein YoxC
MLALLVVWYNQNEKRERNRLAQTKADIADMSILFQTMRDIMHQQKELARDFNQEIEKKMSLVRQVLSATLEKNERLYEKQQKLAQDLQESRAQLESLQRQLSYIRKDNPEEESPPVPALAPPAPREEPAPASFVEEESALLPPLEDDNPAADIKAWLSAEPDTFSEPYPAPEEEEEEEETSLTSEEAQSARDAFRSLLNMTSPTGAPPPAQPTGKENGGSKGPSLQQRVLEYSQAGMSISDIATELGIGKGEVRLMLSLGRQKRP